MSATVEISRFIVDQEGGIMRGRILLASAVAGVGLLFTASSASSQIHNDHYACYQLKHKFPKGQAGTLSNQVEVAGQYAKCKLKHLCVPTLKNGGGNISNANAHYLVWQCKGGKPVVPYTVSDQFASGVVTTKKLKFLLNLASMPPSTTGPCAGGGARVGGFCWYLGDQFASCDSTCGAMGMTCDPATVTYAGSGGTTANCQAVVDAVNGAGLTVYDSSCTYPTDYFDAGCVIWAPPWVTLYAERCIGGTTTCSAVSPPNRLCACE
jgi:hypothetical protein